MPATLQQIFSFMAPFLGKPRTNSHKQTWFVGGWRAAERFHNISSGEQK